MPKITLEQLEKYCIDESIRNVATVQKINDTEADGFYRGRAAAFMWVAACIQNDSIPKRDEG